MRRRFAAAPAMAVVYGVCALHYTWAALLFWSPVAARSTPVSVIVHGFGGRYQGAIALLFAGLLAQAAPLVPRFFLPAVLVPQQAILLTSAAAGIYAAVQQRYADGVLRGWPFILGDQAPMILAAVLYAIALVSVWRWEG